MSGRKSGWLEGDPGRGGSKIRVGLKWSALGLVLLVVAVAAILGGSMMADIAMLSETTTVAMNADIWQIMSHAQFVGDKIGLESLENNGQIFRLPANTRVRIVGLGLKSAKIRVLNGVWTGQEGWIAYEFLAR